MGSVIHFPYIHSPCYYYMSLSLFFACSVCQTGCLQKTKKTPLLLALLLLCNKICIWHKYRFSRNETETPPPKTAVFFTTGTLHTRHVELRWVISLYITALHARQSLTLFLWEYGRPSFLWLNSCLTVMLCFAMMLQPTLFFSTDAYHSAQAQEIGIS